MEFLKYLFQVIKCVTKLYKLNQQQYQFVKWQFTNKLVFRASDLIDYKIKIASDSNWLLYLLQLQIGSESTGCPFKANSFCRQLCKLNLTRRYRDSSLKDF